jgi:hypothetical protein
VNPLTAVALRRNIELPSLYAYSALNTAYLEMHDNKSEKSLNACIRFYVSLGLCFVDWQAVTQLYHEIEHYIIKQCFERAG